MPALEVPPAADGDDAHRLIFGALDVGLLRVSLDGHILEANPCAGERLGAPPDTLIGRHLLDLLHPDEKATGTAQLDAVLAGSPLPIVVHLLRAPDGGRQARVPLQVHLLRAPDGRAVQLLGRMLAQQGPIPPALSTAPPEASTGFDVLAGMGHALRTPLNAMLGFAQLLRVDPQQSLSPSQREKVAHIEQSGAQLLNLVSNVIDLARLEVDRLPLQIQMWPLSPVLDDVLAGVSATAAQRGVVLERQPAEAEPSVWADLERLKQVLRTLLLHLVQEPGPGGRILLEVQILNHQVALTLSDTRPASQVWPHARWLETHQAAPAPAPSDGTHLGLLMARRLIELMQGRIQVSSAPGMGTRLRIWLPQGQTLNATTMPPAPPHRSAFGDLDGVPGEQALTVLYAEDNVVNIELVRQVMRMRPQWRLEVAYCGQDAIAMALRDPPDLLLLDMHLGDMSGLDVSNVLTRQAYTADIPRVALSADVLPDHIREARAQGFADYLTKPLDVERLLRLLDRVAQRKAG